MEVQKPIRRGDFIVYYDPVVKAPCLINIQDYYKQTGKDKKTEIWYVYYKAYNLDKKHLYYDGSRMAINLDAYPSCRLAIDTEISEYLEALKKEGLTL